MIPTAFSLMDRRGADDGGVMQYEAEILGSGDTLGRDLASAIGFTAAELDANRVGRIAETQRHRLWTAAMEPLRKALFALLGWLLFLAIVWIAVPHPLITLLEMRLGLSIWILFALITISASLAFLSKLLGAIPVALRLICDILAAQAGQVEGRLTPSTSVEELEGMGRLYQDTEDQFGFAIGEDILAVNEAAHRLMRPYAGSTCRVFLTPRSRLLLSVEPLKIRRADRLLH